MAAGWGKDSSGKPAEKLNEVCIPLVNERECQREYKNEAITDLMLCAGKVGSFHNVCHGDSGGPVVAYDEVDKKWVLGGVVSWGKSQQCGKSYEVLARVTKMIQWIQETTIFNLKDPFRSDPTD